MVIETKKKKKKKRQIIDSIVLEGITKNHRQNLITHGMTRTREFSMSFLMFAWNIDR